MKGRSIHHQVACALALIFGLIFVSCNMSGYNDLGEPVNRFGQFGTDASTFIHAQKSETERSVELITLSYLEEGSGSCAFLRVTENPKTVVVEMKEGSYEIRDTELITAYSMHYINRYEEKSSPSKTHGAIQQQLYPWETVRMSWHHDPSSGIIELGGKRFKSIALVYDALFMGNSPGWMDQFIKIYHLGTMSAHCRIDGFAGLGMLQYLEKRTLFYGLLSGTLEMRVSGLSDITTVFSYRNHSDIEGLIFTGKITNSADMSGNGGMTGGIQFSVRGTAGIWEGIIDYSDIRVTHTVPSAGQYRVTMPDSVYEVDYFYGNPGFFDFTDVPGLDVRDLSKPQFVHFPPEKIS
jgi:hypothetical protein